MSYLRRTSTGLNDISWVDIETTLTSLQNQINTINTRLKRTPSLYYEDAVEISENTDMRSDTYKNVGLYRCSQNVKAATLKNCPTKNAFMLWVFKLIGGNYIQQYYMEFALGAIWVQFYFNDSATANGWQVRKIAGGNLEVLEGYIDMLKIIANNA